MAAETTSSTCDSTARRTILSIPQWANVLAECGGGKQVCNKNRAAAGYLTSRKAEVNASSQGSLTARYLRVDTGRVPVPPGYVPVGGSQRFFWNDSKPLGSGFTSTVYEGIDLRAGARVAVKVVSKVSQRILATEAYYRYLYELLPPLTRHPYLLHLLAFIEDGDNFFIISNVCYGGTLVDYVTQFHPSKVPIEVTRRVLIQVLLGLHQLHRFGILHRDIKLDNVLFADKERSRVQLIDYDMAYILESPKEWTTSKSRDDEQEQLRRRMAIAARAYGRRGHEITVVGTKDYLAPESFQGRYSRQSDLWSVGVILYILLDGHFPFNFKTHSLQDKLARQTIRRGIDVRPSLRKRHPEAVHLLGCLLSFDPQQRPRSVIEVLEHPWLRGADPSADAILTSAFVRRVRIKDPAEQECRHARREDTGRGRNQPLGTPNRQKFVTTAPVLRLTESRPQILAAAIPNHMPQHMVDVVTSKDICKAPHFPTCDDAVALPRTIVPAEKILRSMPRFPSAVPQENSSVGVDSATTPAPRERGTTGSATREKGGGGARHAVAAAVRRLAGGLSAFPTEPTVPEVRGDLEASKSNDSIEIVKDCILHDDNGESEEVHGRFNGGPTAGDAFCFFADKLPYNSETDKDNSRSKTVVTGGWMSPGSPLLRFRERGFFARRWT